MRSTNAQSDHVITTPIVLTCFLILNAAACLASEETFASTMSTNVLLPLALMTHCVHSRLLPSTSASVYLVGMEPTAQKMLTTVNQFRVNTVLDVQMVMMLTRALAQLDTLGSIVPQILMSAYPPHAQTVGTVPTTLLSLLARAWMVLLAKHARTLSKVLHRLRHQLHRQFR
jgi:hypothetical protein